MQMSKGKKPGPRKPMVYGEHGLGKSSIAACSPKPLFLDIEQGTNDLDVERWPEPIVSYGQFVQILKWVRTQEHEYKTLVIDTVDWLERLIFKQIAEFAGVQSVADIDYGKGFPRAIPMWEFILGELDYIFRERRMTIVLLSHARIEHVKNPEGAEYDRYSPDLWINKNGEGAGRMLQEWASDVFFIRKKKFVRTEGKGFNERGMAVGTEEREMLTSDTAFASAKNRLNMPTIVPATWDEYLKYVVANLPKKAEPIITEPAGNISGIVVDGTSKKKEESPQIAEMQVFFGDSQT